MEQLSKHQKIAALYDLVISITDPADCKALFEDLVKLPARDPLLRVKRRKAILLTEVELDKFL